METISPSLSRSRNNSHLRGSLERSGDYLKRRTKPRFILSMVCRAYRRLFCDSQAGRKRARQARIIILFLTAWVFILWSTGQAEGKRVSQSVSEPSRPLVSAASKQLTEDDYVQPLENWLKAQGSPLSGKDFYEVGREKHVDPDFLIAVTRAETSLGKVPQRGSAFNIGSVCSYDSTNTTCAAQSYRHGIEMIADTVNNRLLGGYTRVSQLSRFGNCCGPVYASSPINWHRNVVGTMNALKGKNEADYEFRR